MAEEYIWTQNQNPNRSKRQLALQKNSQINTSYPKIIRIGTCAALEIVCVMLRRQQRWQWRHLLSSKNQGNSHRTLKWYIEARSHQIKINFYLMLSNSQIAHPPRSSVPLPFRAISFGVFLLLLFVRSFKRWVVLCFICNSLPQLNRRYMSNVRNVCSELQFAYRVICIQLSSSLSLFVCTSRMMPISMARRHNVTMREHTRI